MRDFNALAISREDDRMITNHVTAAQRRKTDVTPLPFAGVAVAGAHRTGLEIDTAPCRFPNARTLR